jgi:hypothetical protein
MHTFFLIDHVFNSLRLEFIPTPGRKPPFCNIEDICTVRRDVEGYVNSEQRSCFDLSWLMILSHQAQGVEDRAAQ